MLSSKKKMKRILKVLMQVLRQEKKLDRESKEVKELLRLGQNLVVMQLP